MEVEAIITRPDKPKGRSSTPSSPPVKEKALQIAPHIPLYQPTKVSAPEFKSTLENFKSSLFVVVAFGEILKPHVLSIPQNGCINVHGSVLPKYRGAAPMQRALMNGEKETGVTIIEMVAEMDAGDVLEIKKMAVPEDMCLGELEPALARLGVEALLEVFTKIQTGTLRPLPQDHSLATFAAKITADEEKIDWSQPNTSIHNRIRALSPSPGAWSTVNLSGVPKRLKIKKSKIVSSQQGTPGENLRCDPSEWIVACGEGAIQLLEVQLEGKKNMKVSDFLRGLQSSSPSFI